MEQIDFSKNGDCVYAKISGPKRKWSLTAQQPEHYEGIVETASPPDFCLYWLAHVGIEPIKLQRPTYDECRAALEVACKERGFDNVVWLEDIKDVFHNSLSCIQSRKGGVLRTPSQRRDM